MTKPRRENGVVEECRHRELERGTRPARRVRAHRSPSAGGPRNHRELGCRVLVALASGDAYLFDLEDKLACVLCRGGERTRFNVQDRGKQWAFEWPYIYEQRGGRIWLFRNEADDAQELTGLRARDLERAVRRYNQRAGTNYHL